MELFEKYYTFAVRFLSHRPRSEKEVRDNLTKKKAPPEMIDAIITTLKEQRFLSDEEFVKWWRDQRTRFRPKSDRAIKIELQQKGVARETIAKIFEETEEKFLSDFEKAKKLVEKQLPKLTMLKRDQQYQKLGAFLARRGFDWDTIKAAIDDIFERRYNTD